ncbi:hypothetical protein ABTU92_30330, partial [Rhodoplanes sp. SY1]
MLDQHGLSGDGALPYAAAEFMWASACDGRTSRPINAPRQVGTMLVHLKGLHRVRAKLSDGRDVSYLYAWRGGPPLMRPDGTRITSRSDPYIATAFGEAQRGRAAKTTGQLSSLITLFKGSTEFTNDIAERTRRDYRRHLDAIEAEFGDMPIAALSDRRARGLFKRWRDDLAKSSKRQADYAWTVLARVLS